MYISLLLSYLFLILAYSYAEARKTDDALQEKDNLHYDVRNIQQLQITKFMYVSIVCMLYCVYVSIVCMCIHCKLGDEHESVLNSVLDGLRDVSPPLGSISDPCLLCSAQLHGAYCLSCDFTQSAILALEKQTSQLSLVMPLCMDSV